MKYINFTIDENRNPKPSRFKNFKNWQYDPLLMTHDLTDHSYKEDGSREKEAMAQGSMVYRYGKKMELPYTTHKIKECNFKPSKEFKNLVKKHIFGNVSYYNWMAKGYYNAKKRRNYNINSLTLVFVLDAINLMYLRQGVKVKIPINLLQKSSFKINIKYHNFDSIDYESKEIIFDDRFYEFKSIRCYSCFDGNECIICNAEGFKFDNDYNIIPCEDCNGLGNNYCRECR
jgi:hypothetical protein